MGPMRNWQFYLKVEFVDIDEYKDAVVLALWKEDRAIGFSSEIIEREDYKITRVVITNISSECQYGKFWAIWECISDGPGQSLIIT
jgi:phosphoribosylformimino-5-aminoimidazole carboxamide ribonucleotide (ProFAR) isomerase